MAAPTLYILYNADASLVGKMSYGYRKITTKKDCTPACAACDITHGGLHLDETAKWKEAKGEMLESGAVSDVKQFHRDELDGETKAFVQSQGLQFPMVLVKEEGGGLRSVMNGEELAVFNGDSKAFMQKVRESLEGSKGKI
ncbi:MAG: hypothetical protein Q9216_002438 [Gyalolechia sp. 2 TL-2023]